MVQVQKQNISNKVELKSLRSLKSYLSKRKTSWGVLIYNPKTGHRVVAQTMGKAVKKYSRKVGVGKSKDCIAPLVVTHRNWQKLKENGKL